MTLMDALYAQGLRAFREPREAAADVIALDVPRDALVPGLFAIVALSVLLNAVAEFLAPTAMNLVTPFQMTLFLLALFVTFAGAVYKVGEAMGGNGTFANSLLLSIFFQAIFLPAQALQVLLISVTPALANVVGLIIFVLGIWINVNFVAALHGYPSLGKAIGVILIASLVVAIVMIFVAPMIGISLFGAVPNV